MLSPGSASALVNAALEWLQPQVIQALTSSLLHSGADTNQGNGRQGRGDAATAPGPLCSALAAVLQFLRAHIQARQVWLHACYSHNSNVFNAFQFMMNWIHAGQILSFQDRSVLSNFILMVQALPKQHQQCMGMVGTHCF